MDHLPAIAKKQPKNKHGAEWGAHWPNDPHDHHTIWVTEFSEQNDQCAHNPRRNAYSAERVQPSREFRHRETCVRGGLPVQTLLKNGASLRWMSGMSCIHLL